MVNIKEVAKLAGVSITSVSRVVNNSRSVSDKVKEKVNYALRELDYVPNTLAQTMRKQKSNYIGVIVSDILDPFFAELYMIIESSLKKSGYKTILINGPFDDIENTVQNLYHWNIEGVVICFAHIEGQWNDILQRYGKKIPFIVMETVANQGNYNRIYVNVEDGMYKAVKYLIKQGHKRIAYLRGNPLLPDGRYKGYLHAHEESGIPYEPGLIFECDYDISAGGLAAADILNLEKRPTAIVAINDTIAFGALKFLLQNGVKVPEDISVIGFDDNMIAKVTYPELSTVRIPIRTLGENASKTLVKCLKNENAQFANLAVQTELIIRGTT